MKWQSLTAFRRLPLAVFILGNLFFPELFFFSELCYNKREQLF